MSFCASFQTTAFAQKKSERDQYTITVEGLGCPFCAYGLEKKFKEFKGIKHIKIEMETGVFTFSFPADKPLSVEQVKNQVEEAGYTAKSTVIKRTDGSIEKDELIIEEKIVSEDAVVLKDDFFVAGNCNMCAARIEKTALKLNGVFKAKWNKKSKMLTVEFDENSTTISAIEKAIAKAGHDTSTAKADDEIYNNLPPCCLYDRK